MQFDHQVFISYACLDDVPLPMQAQGCVTLLHQTLKALVDRKLGRRTDFWRDVQRLDGATLLTQEIIDSLDRSAVMVAVLSKRYLESDYCRLELSHFCETAGRSGGLVVDNHCRVFKVFLVPLTEQERARQPELTPLHDIRGYEFYEQTDGGCVIDLSPLYGPDALAKYLLKATALASDIAKVVAELEEGAAAAAVSRAGKGPTVYLATAGHDRSAARDSLMMTLTRLNCTVLPDGLLPADEEQFVVSVAELLRRSAIAVHLIGTTGGIVPDGPSAQPVEELQCRIAAKVAESRKLARLIWLPEGTAPVRPAQAEFIRSLQEDAQTQRGADLLVGSLESLKEAMEGAIREELRPPSGTVDRNPAQPELCLVCCEADRKGLVPLIKYLRAHCEVRLPVFTGSAAEVREANREMMLRADLVCLYYGAGDEAWKYHQSSEITRIRAMRGGPAAPPEYLLLGLPSTDDKELLASLEDPRTIDLRAGMSMQSQAALSGLFGTLPTERSAAPARDRTP